MIEVEMLRDDVENVIHGATEGLNPVSRSFGRVEPDPIDCQGESGMPARICCRVGRYGLGIDQQKSVLMLEQQAVAVELGWLDTGRLATEASSIEGLHSAAIQMGDLHCA